jgi:L,D-peptidoglycan transpeptidase YkuD (ErfK/YbiS/YcfS/YnhG family)
MYGNSTTVPSHRYAYHHLRCGDWWDGNLNSSRYNTFRHLACGARGPGGGSEALWRMTRAYQHVAVINYNMDPVTPGRGSAIFLHDFTSLPSTSGCVSIAPSVLDKVLAWLDPAQHPVIRIGTSKEVHAPR